MNHIKYEDGVSRCGEPLDHNFYFKDLEQVIINNLHGERIACQYCLRAVVTSLLIVAPGAKSTIPAQSGILGD